MFRSFLKTLPDKGARINEHLEVLIQEQERRLEEKRLQSNVVTSQTDTTKSETSPTDSAFCERLNEALQKLNVQDDKTVSSKSDDTTKHYYEVAVERAQQNSKAGIREPIKLNR